MWAHGAVDGPHGAALCILSQPQSQIFPGGNDPLECEFSSGFCSDQQARESARVSSTKG